jgi:ketosteroid isomerase-like protein
VAQRVRVRQNYVRGKFGTPRTKRSTRSVPLLLTFAAVYTIHDGKIARGREYWTRQEALEAVGLRE